MRYILTEDKDFPIPEVQINALFTHLVALHPGKLGIFCGRNRKGDIGLYLAHRLSQETQINVTVMLLSAEEEDIYQQLFHDDLTMVTNQRRIRQLTGQMDMLVDCVGDSTGPYSYWISWINESGVKTVSLECPTGLDTVTGAMRNSAVKASETLVCGNASSGLFIYPGNEYAGNLIYMAEETAVKSDTFLYQYADITKLLPERKKHSHKGTYGKVLLIAGSEGKVGAAILCARAILKTGAGMLTVLSYPEVCTALNNNLYEAMTIKLLPEDLNRQLNDLDIDSYDLIVFGPGMGRNDITEQLLEYVLRTKKPLVIDADGLFFLKKYLYLLKREQLTVLTPHLGEYSRILPYQQETVIDDLRSFSREYPNSVMVLKGENTMIAHAGKITVNDTGNSALAKAGSGDVLCGTIGGLMAQKPEPESVICGVYIHGKAADRWIERNSAYSLLASELTDEITKVLFEMTEEHK